MELQWSISIIDNWEPEKKHTKHRKLNTQAQKAQHTQAQPICLQLLQEAGVTMAL